MNRLVPAVALSVLLLALTGCAAKKKLSADRLLSEATKEYQQGSYPLAIENYRELLDQHPFSKHGEEAELRIAQAHFLSDEFAEAIAAFTDFQRRHPTSPQLPLVGYLLGLCYMEQMSTIDRDQSASQSAHNYFATVAQQYPESPFAELARAQLADCRASLAEHELYVAHFYTRHENPKAAEMRLLRLIGSYQDAEAAAEGLDQLAALYREQGNGDLAALADAALARYYPTHPHSKGARRRLRRSNSEDSLAAGDPLPRLLAALPPSNASALAEPVQVPGLETPEARPAYTGAATAPALAPPGAFDRAGRY